MKNDLLHTPEGVRDIYGDECAKKLRLEEILHKNLKAYGFRDIETPSFEFFDIFNKERGSVASRNMYKFFDRDGNTMVLRPDITPSIARCAAKYFADENLPLKFCYKANTFINNNSYQGRLKETTQVGAELIGDDSIYADAEMLVLIIESLLNSGLEEFQLEIGDVSFFKGIVSESGISSDNESELRDLILNKCYFGIEELVKDLDKSVADKFIKLGQLFGTVEVLEEAKKLTNNTQALDAIERLYVLYDIVKKYGYEKYITFDLGLLGELSYYTGIVFRAYTYGTGDAVVKGGRYDGLVSQFGKNAPAIGFSFITDKLLIALSRQKLEIKGSVKDTMILYLPDCYDAAITMSKEARGNGININTLLKKDSVDIAQYVEFAKRNNIDTIKYIKADNDIELISVQ